MGGKYKGAGGAAYGRTPTGVQIRFDKREMGEMQGRIMRYLLNPVWAPPAASIKEKPAQTRRAIAISRKNWKAPGIKRPRVKALARGTLLSGTRSKRGENTVE